MTSSGDDYRDQPVRPYVLTGGRAAPSRNTIRPETLVASEPGRPLPATMGRAERTLLGVCRQPLSLAEAAVHLRLPVSVVVIVASDLIVSGYLSVRTPATTPDRQLLEEVLDGLRELSSG